MTTLSANPGLLTPLDLSAILQFQHKDTSHRPPTLLTCSWTTLIIHQQHIQQSQQVALYNETHFNIDCCATFLYSESFNYSYVITFEVLTFNFTLLDGGTSEY